MMNPWTVSAVVILVLFFGFMAVLKFWVWRSGEVEKVSSLYEITQDKEELIRMAFIEGCIAGYRVAGEEVIADFKKKPMKGSARAEYETMKREIRKLGYYFSKRERRKKHDNN